MATTTVLDATSGGASANTYCVLADADQYHADRFPQGTTWLGEGSDSLTDAKKNKLLLTATRLLDDTFIWDGWVVNETQALLWPRVGLYLRSGYYADPDDGIPTDLRDATAELARQLADDIARMQDSDIETKGITSLKVGSISLQFSANVVAKVIPDLISAMLPNNWFTGIRGRLPSVLVAVR